MVKPGSGGLAVLKHELELRQNHVLISTPGRPVLDNFPAGHEIDPKNKIGCMLAFNPIYADTCHPNDVLAAQKAM